MHIWVQYVHTQVGNNSVVLYVYEGRCVVMKVYISGPMSGYTNLNVYAFHAMAARLHAMGYCVANPADVHVDGWQWVDYMNCDLAMLRDCDAMIMLPGWEHSKGARIERRYAKRRRIVELSI